MDVLEDRVCCALPLPQSPDQKKLRSSGELEKRKLHCSWHPLKATLELLQRKQQHPKHSVPPSPACSLQCPTTANTHGRPCDTCTKSLGQSKPASHSCSN